MLGLLGKYMFRARSFGVDLYALYLATRDSRTPWYARVLGLLVVAYLLSPIDLIPIVVPFFGLVDDLVIVPFGLKIVSTLVPLPVWAEAQSRASRSVVAHPRFWRWAAAVLAAIFLIWLIVIGLLVYLIVSWLW